MSGVGPITNSKFVILILTGDFLSLKLVFSKVPGWPDSQLLLVIKLLRFLKVSGVGPITNSQICHISVDCWILVIEWWYFWRSPELARLPTHKFVILMLTGNYLLLNQLTAEYLSLNWWYFWRCPELARLPTHKFITFQLTAEYLSLNWWYFWRCPELARLPTHKFVTFQLTAEHLSLNWWYFWRSPELCRIPTHKLSYWCWLVITCYWIGDIFEGVRIWLDNQVSILSHWSWLVITLH